jgi:hypothetical protein
MPLEPPDFFAWPRHCRTPRGRESRLESTQGQEYEDRLDRENDRNLLKPAQSRSCLPAGLSVRSLEACVEGVIGAGLRDIDPLTESPPHRRVLAGMGLGVRKACRAGQRRSLGFDVFR